MVVGIRRVLLAAAAMLILVVDVQPTACEVPSLLRPISTAGKMVAATTTAVAKSSATVLKAVATAPKRLLPKLGTFPTPKKQQK